MLALKCIHKYELILRITYADMRDANPRKNLSSKKKCCRRAVGCLDV